MNRELSWLKFNERVLNEAGNERVPLAERLTFLSIYQTNLDEFFRVRVGTLMRQDKSGKVIRDNKTNMTSREQIDAILENARNLDIKKQSIYDQVMGPPVKQREERSEEVLRIADPAVSLADADHEGTPVPVPQ